MRRRSIAAIALVPALGLAWPLAAQQQSTPASHQQDQAPPGAPVPQRPVQTKKKPSESEQNPFPEAQSEKAAHEAQQQDSTSSKPDTPSAPDAAQPSTKVGKTTDRNPFPETQSEDAQHARDQSDGQGTAPRDGQKPADSPDSGKNPQDYSSSHLKLLDLPGGDNADPNAAGANGHNPALATKDTQVGMFYLKTGDYQGAYNRFAEATKADPGNADAVFGLAETARRLNHRDEAVRNYQLYLSALPDGPRAKDSRKALKELRVTPHS